MNSNKLPLKALKISFTNFSSIFSSIYFEELIKRDKIFDISNLLILTSLILFNLFIESL